MKRKGLTLALTAVLFGVISSNIFTSTSNNPPARTGSPGDKGETCVGGGCHAGTAKPIANWIKSDIPATGYVPGTTYTITATATGKGMDAFGFEIAPQDDKGNMIGKLVVTNAKEMELVGNGKFISQNKGGKKGKDSKTWSFKWIAPKNGPATFNFYGAFLVKNTMTAKEVTYTSKLTINKSK